MAAGPHGTETSVNVMVTLMVVVVMVTMVTVVTVPAVVEAMAVAVELWW